LIPIGAQGLPPKPGHKQRLDAHKQALKNVTSLTALTKDFQDALKQSVKGFIDAGKVLIRAKTELKHGQWEEWIIRELRFGERKRNGAADLRKAQELMLLAGHPIISNPDNFGALPSSRRTLTELSQIPEENLLEHIKNGVVHPGMTRKDAAELKPRPPKENQGNPEVALTLADPIKALHHFCIYVGRPDVLRAYDRSLKREPDLPSKEEFDRAVQFAAEIYESRTGGQP
jgi:hypothetical protein